MRADARKAHVLKHGRWARDQLFFFFSSRRRHTGLQGDWSSDVCSSDLAPSTCPPSRAVTAGEAPVNGTVMRPAPVSELSVSTQKSPTDPAPAVPTRTLPGFFFACSAIWPRVL